MATAWYMALTAVFSIARAQLERWMDARGVKVSDPKQTARTLEVSV